jgi:tetratricopeptide (TPR) repeat protein
MPVPTSSAEEGFKKAIVYYNEAIHIDPDYAAAYAELANTYGTLLYFGHLAPNETLHMMSAAVEKALRLDDTVTEAHLTLAKIRFYYEWDFPGAEREFKRAIELNPSHAEARLFYAFYLDALGRFDEAALEAKRAVELDPLSLIINLLAGFVYFLASRNQLAEEQSRKLLDMEPNFHGAYLLLGMTYVLTERYEEAIDPYKKALSLGGGPGQLGYLGFVYAAAGRRSDALEVIAQLDEIRKQRYVPAYFTAVIYAGLGEVDEAFKWLEKAYEERNGPLAILNRESAFNAMHSDPRFQDLLRRIGLG